MVVGACDTERKAEPDCRGGAGGSEMGVVPGLFHEGAVAELLPGAEGKRLKDKAKG